MILPNGRIKTAHPFAEVRLLNFEGAQAAANWVIGAGATGTPSIADAPEYGIDSTNALRIAQADASASRVAQYRFYNAAGWDCSKSDVFTLAWEYAAGQLPSRSRSGGGGSITVLMSSDGDNVFTNNATIAIAGGGAWCGLPTMGRNVMSWLKSNATVSGIDWSNVTNIRFSLNTTNATDAINIQGLWCGRRMSPVVSIVFDDGWASAGLGANEACTIANAAGIPLTLSIIPGLSEGSDGSTYLSEAEIAAIDAAGNSITVHGTGPAGVGSLVDYADSGRAQVAADQAWLQARGYDHQHFVYPGGGFNGQVLSVMRDLGFKTARTLAGTSYKGTAWSAGATVTTDVTYRQPTAVFAASATDPTPQYLTYLCTAGGTTGGTEPNPWPTTRGETINDNGVEWTCVANVWPSRISYYGITPSVAGMPSWYEMNACPLNNVLTLTQVLAEVDRMIAKGESIILYGHKLGGAADSLTFVTSDFTSLIAALALRQRHGLCDVMTIPQMYAALASSDASGTGVRPRTASRAA